MTTAHDALDCVIEFKTLTHEFNHLDSLRNGVSITLVQLLSKPHNAHIIVPRILSEWQTV